MTVYEECNATHSGELNQVVQCIAEWAELNRPSNNTIESNTNDDSQSTDVQELRRWLLIICGALIFFMQTGFAMICAGCVRKKNMNNSMLKNLLDVCGAAIAFYATGYAIAYGGTFIGYDPTNSTNNTTNFVGTENFFLSGNNVDPAFFFFQFAFSATSTTIVAGTLAERCRMGAYLCFSLVLSGFVYPIVAHNIWSSTGIFSVSNPNAVTDTAMLDFAGSGVVHITGGISALYATCILRPRQGRFYDRHGNKLAKPGLRTGANVAMQMLGTLMLIFGWIGFNPGSALLLPMSSDQGFIAGHAAVATVLSAAGATISALLINGAVGYRRTGEFDFDVFIAMNGCLTGLVSITGGCGIVDFWAALLIGAVGGLIYILSVKLMISRMIDDAVEAIPVHLAGGMWGVIAVGLFANPNLVRAAYGSDVENYGWFFNLSDLSLLGSQLLEIVFIIGWVSLTMFPLFSFLNYFGWFRVNALEEFVGLDTTYMTTEIINEENSDSNEEVRLAAYRQRFAERKQQRRGGNKDDFNSISVSEEHAPVKNDRNPSLNLSIGEEHSPIQNDRNLSMNLSSI